MKILHTYNYNQNREPDISIDRIAVRAIVQNPCDDLLMIYSFKNGDYKFPGGGVEKLESTEDALRRELLEETGANLIEIVEEFGIIYEYNCQSDIIPNKTFNMMSIYFLCYASEISNNLNLDEYEKQLGFTPKYVSISDAICINTKMLNEKKMPRWTKRDTFVLELLNNKINKIR